MRTRRRLSAIGATMVAALALAGCSLGDPEASADGGGGDSGGEEVTFVAGTGTVPHLNPQVINSPSVNRVAGGILEKLVMMNDSLELVPWLATEWETSDDGLDVTLQLREGVEWHDGEPFTSEDVKFNFDEVMQYQSYGGPLVDSIDSVEAPDEHTVVVHLKEPYGPFMEVLTLQYMLPKHIYAGTDILENPANQEPVGTGPFIFESFKEGDEVTMTANPDYWRGEMHVDRSVYVKMVDTNATALSLLSGEFAVGGAGQGMLDQIRANEDLAMTQNGQTPRQFMFQMNSKNPILEDPEVRKLVYQSVDRAQLTETALPEVSSVPSSMFPDALSWIEPGVDYQEMFPYEPEAIGEAFDKLGYPVKDDGFRFTVRLHFMSSTAESKAVAQVMKASMAEVGINLDLKGQDVTIFQDNVYQKRDFDLAIIESTLGMDPSLGITRWYECNPEKDYAQNASSICDDEMQAAADKALHSGNREERAEAFRVMQDRAAELMFAAPIVFHTARTVYNEAQWEGLADHLLGGTDWINIKPKG